MYEYTKNRETGTTIELVAIADGWSIACIDHGGQCLEFSSKREAKRFRAFPSNFCSDCAAIVYGSENNN